jgi:hypothetical protein
MSQRIPSNGVGQKISQFWQSIKEKCDAIFDSEGLKKEGGEEQRSADALLNRFQRMIEKEMNIFSNPYRYILLSLGTVDSEYIDKAAERYLAD